MEQNHELPLESAVGQPQRPSQPPEPEAVPTPWGRFLPQERQIGEKPLPDELLRQMAHGRSKASGVA
jgi:hypothetical protein